MEKRSANTEIISVEIRIDCLRRNVTKFVPLVLFLTGCVVGCGQKSPTRAVTSGSVSYQGKPVEFGDILFDPQMDGTKGKFAQGKILAGKYSFDSGHGPIVGKNIVRIHGYKMTGRKRLDIAGKDLSKAPEIVNELMPYIPEKFNEASGITVEIQPGANENVNFEL